MKKECAGFTLLETLIVVFLIGLVLVAGGNIFFGIMKGASKAEIEREVKQNGEYALAIMERMIRNSRSVLVCDEMNNILEIENPDEFSTTFQVLDDSGVNRLASSSANILYLTGENIDVSSFTLSCFPSEDVDTLRRVGISFTLVPKGVTAGEVPPEMYAEINFQTSISLRNF